LQKHANDFVAVRKEFVEKCSGDVPNDANSDSANLVLVHVSETEKQKWFEVNHVAVKIPLNS
jgi:hypothetical protein